MLILCTLCSVSLEDEMREMLPVISQTRGIKEFMMAGMKIRQLTRLSLSAEAVLVDMQVIYGHGLYNLTPC